MKQEEVQLDPFQMRELWLFQQAMAKRGYSTTVVLGTVMVVLFLLEYLWGGPTYIPTVYRMGANAHDAVAQGEIWRLCTSIFLHGNWLHIGFNVYVLIVLGSFFDRVLGGPKFLALFILSGLCGSLASILISKSAVSLGASGSLWGIFGASAALTMRPSPYLPDVLRLRIRRMTIINILLNLAISLLPALDIWAHIGGGIGGYCLGLIFLRFEARRLQIAQVERAYMTHPLVLVSIAIVIASFAWGFSTQRPWEMKQAPHLTMRTLGNSGFAIGIPRFLAERVASSQNQKTALYHFGHLPFDPYEIAIAVSPFNQPLEREELKNGLEMLKGQLPNYQAEGFMPLRARRTFVLEGVPTGEEVFQRPTGEVLYTWYQVREREVIHIELLAMPNTPPILLEDAGDILKTWRQLA